MTDAAQNNNIKKAIAKHGREKCITAYRMNYVQGEGASTIGIEMGVTTRQADAMINAGRAIYVKN